MKHLTIRVSGKVQGVFFRASTKEKADVLAVKGFVRNEPNGDVYIEAEGEEVALHEFEAWCQQGPPRASVSNIDVHTGEIKNFTDFTVQR